MLQDEKVFNFEDDLDILDKAIKENVSWVEVYDFLLSLQPFSSSKAVGGLVKAIAIKVKGIKESFEKEQNRPYDYVNSFSMHTGSLAECDGFTQLIQQALKHIEEQYRRKTVLIIEDMDKLDPGHLFRILNVLGAQIDNPYFESDRKEESERNPNKFGFSKIVLVTDYSTSEHIFHHFYGQESDYEGYMQKFLDVNPFNFSLRSEAQRMLIEKIKSVCNVDEAFFRKQIKINGILVNDNPSVITFIEKLSLRRCKQLIIQNIDDFIKKDNQSEQYIRTLRILVYLRLLIPTEYSLSKIYEVINDNADDFIDIIYPVLRNGSKNFGTDYTIMRSFKPVRYVYDMEKQTSKQVDAYGGEQNPLNFNTIKSVWYRQRRNVLGHIDMN